MPLSEIDKKLLLIDGLNLIRRLYAALESEKDDIRRIERVQGACIDAIAKLVKLFDSTHIAIVFDSPEKTWRHTEYPEYKLGRAPMDDSLFAAIEGFAKVFRFNHWHCIRLSGWEADDIIATLASKSAERGVKSIIVSTDKGFTQLLEEPNIYQYDYFGKQGFDKDWVVAKYGVFPQQMTDYWAFVGDTTNHIPGIKGIGPKTAASIFQAEQSIESVFANLEQQSARIQSQLEGNLDHALWARKMVTLRQDVSLGIRLSQLEIRSTNL
ncbi:flap endonuclease Xni [Marinomonas mediterranea]|uniref:5'-3' exonuclease, SAM-fold domain-containing protein n=1 Tax=Marinomonas mediterranea (strain ATCC 700492 / JCM 21426 / NBRC 103028 / MMB-1) TaxID=717774 RepID=F2JXA5_MARM1|nr:flap endonuclease Xni [Marinomonas mediterranea]ADZ90711.1 5'-3' exonuclease, SAM-fold domain-containing protein [Marinomonas mediterranea MMB-1]